MKKITLALVALGLIVGLNSCKESTKEDVTEITSEMSYDDDGGDDDGGHDDDGHGHDHDGGTMMVGKEVIVSMGSKNSSNVAGKILLTQGEKAVSMVVSLTGLTAGEHAIHIHQNGDCSSDDGKSAGGHWDPTAEDHGKWGAAMHHSGDIGNLVANDAGGATLTFSTDKWCIGCDDKNRNVLGKAFIVHASADDFASQPSGAAGARVACGVIE